MWLHNFGLISSLSSGTSSPTTYSQTVLDQNPVAYYRLEESSLTVGDTVFDETSNNLDGSVDNADATTTTGKVGQAVDYSPNNSRVDVPSDPLLEPSKLTLELWVKLVNSSVNDFEAFAGSTSSTSWDDGYGYVTDGSGNLRFFVDNWDNSGSFVQDGNGTAFDGNWHLLHGVFDGSTLELFIDNVSIDSSSFSNAITYNQSIFNIGTLAESGSFNAQTVAIDEVALYDRALTSQERQAKLDAAN